MATGLMHHGLEAAAARVPDRPALLAGDDRWTYADVERASNAVARYLAGRGVGPGGRVMVMTSNRPEFVAVVHGLSKLGAAPVLVNPAWKAFEVAAAARLTAPGFGVADGAGVGLLGAQLGEARVLDLDGPEATGAVDRVGDAVLPAGRGGGG